MDGVLLLDKPSGLSSNAALQQAKRLFDAKKAGHTGTLDPLASGLLPLCFGEATKFAQVLLDAPKEYLATVRFGVGTDTGDCEGRIVAERPVRFGLEELAAAAGRFVGVVQQLPPRYSALKYRGRNYYEYARAGIDVPRTPRPVEIRSLEVVGFADDVAMLRVACGKGTYVRTLAEDLAGSLDTVGHLIGLRRTATGPFRVDEAIPLGALAALDPVQRHGRLLAVDAPVASVPIATLDHGAALALLQGRGVPAPQGATGEFRAYEAGARFVGLVTARDGMFRPLRMIDAGTAAPDGTLAAES